MHRVDTENPEHTQALLECLRDSPLLVDHLPEAVCFDRSEFPVFSDLSGIPSVELNYAQKLGHLYEDALEYLLTHSPGIELLDKGIQIFDSNQITLGELDYLLQELTTGKFIHLELAVKFYLIKYQDGKPVYPGPDPRDNWQSKLSRLQQHQLKLTHDPATRKLLLGKYGVSEVTPQQLIYGKLFDHYLAAEQPTPSAVNPSCQRGTWKYLSEWQLGSESDSNEQQIIVIPKCLWPVECDESLLSTLIPRTSGELMEEASQRCTMIWDESSNGTQFIAPDTWS